MDQLAPIEGDSSEEEGNGAVDHDEVNSDPNAVDNNVNPEDDKFTAENTRRQRQTVPPTPNTNVIGSEPNGWVTPISVSHQSESDSY